MPFCRYRSVATIAMSPDKESLLLPLEGMRNAAHAQLDIAGASKLSDVIHTKQIQIQTDVPFRIRFTDKDGGEPGDPTPDDLVYPAAVEPRMFAIQIGARFRIVKV